MHYLQMSPVILDGTRLKDLLGELPKMPYKQGIRKTLASILSTRVSGKCNNRLDSLTAAQTF
jgi:hypothetical protein